MYVKKLENLSYLWHRSLESFYGRVVARAAKFQLWSLVTILHKSTIKINGNVMDAEEARNFQLPVDKSKNVLLFRVWINLLMQKSLTLLNLRNYFFSLFVKVMISLLIFIATFVFLQGRKILISENSDRNEFFISEIQLFNSVLIAPLISIFIIQLLVYFSELDRLLGFWYVSPWTWPYTRN